MQTPLRRTGSLFLVLLFPIAACVAGINDDLWVAARKGDTTAVKELLAKGADVNAKFRYGATALSYASDRGHLEVVKVLVEHGADVNVRDTFYGASPLSWAASKGHIEVVRFLLEKGADAGKEAALRMAASGGHTDIVQAVLKKGGVSPDVLTAALAQATKAGHAEIVELLKKAGAGEPPKADFQVDLETLKSYAGVYKMQDQRAPAFWGGVDYKFEVKEGKLVGGPLGIRSYTLAPIDQMTFRVREVEGLSFSFHKEQGKVVGLTIKQGSSTVVFKKADEKQ